MKHQYHDLIKSLNIFSQSTGDFYYFYDYHQKVIHFSDNIATANNALSALQTSINLHDWQNILDKRDINHANLIINKIKNKQTDCYNYNFRIIDKTKHTTWLNNKGKVYYDNEGEIEYILGRLSNYIPSSQTTSYNQKKLKTALNKLCSQALDGYLMIMGIDDLKTINLKSGRAFGDGVISQVVYTIKKMTDSQFPLYRINGDCFALILTNYQKNDVFRLYEKIKNELTHQCTISAGAVSLTDYHITNCNLLIQYSEIALDRAKSNGKNQLCFFNAQNYEQKLAELELIENIQNSINHLYEGFEVYYQPQIHSQTFQLYGAEALLRYISPKGEHIPVPYLISILEQNDLMYQIGLWVLKKALAACKKWRETFPDFHISVNMSYSQLQHDAIEFDIIDIVKNSGVPGKAITIEITESMELANYPHLNSLFKTWKNYGIEISIDDFGTGYSSLSRLKDMAVDEVKIDRCFVTEIQNSIYNYQLLNNIINLAKTSQIRVCCEGVENTPELMVIEKLKPSLYQGFFFGKPCNQTDFEQSFVLSQPVIDVSIFDKNEIEYQENLDKLSIDTVFASGDTDLKVKSNFYADDMLSALKFAKEVLKNPRFDQATLDKVKSELKDDISMLDKDASDKLVAELFKGLPTGYTKEEILNSIDSVTIDDLKELYNFIISNGQANIVVSAPFSKKPELKQIVFNEMSEMPKVTPKNSKIKNIYKEIPQTLVLTDTYTKPQAQIIKAYKFKIGQNLKDETTLNLLNTILGGNPSSRLFQDLREKQKLAYSVHSDISFIDDIGTIELEIGTTTENTDTNEFSYDNLQKSIEGFNKHIEKLKSEKVSDEELNNAKLSLKNVILNSNETNIGKNKSLEYGITSPYGIEAENLILKTIDEITVDDIYNAANYIFKGKPVYSILATDNTLKANKDYLDKLSN